MEDLGESEWGRATVVVVETFVLDAIRIKDDIHMCASVTSVLVLNAMIICRIPRKMFERSLILLDGAASGSM